ncbi:MAG: OmpA family protein [Parvibaculum sp.]
MLRKRFSISSLALAAGLMTTAFTAGLLVSGPAHAVETHSSGKQCNNRMGVGGKFEREYFVYFEPSSTELDEHDLSIIEEVYERATGQHAGQICLFGKASKTGNPASNASLARRRSEAVADRLKRHGWDGSRIAIEPEGETWGWLDELTWENEEDRRVRIRLSR